MSGISKVYSLCMNHAKEQMREIAPFAVNYFFPMTGIMLCRKMQYGSFPAENTAQLILEVVSGFFYYHFLSKLYSEDRSDDSSLMNRNVIVEFIVLQQKNEISRLKDIILRLRKENDRLLGDVDGLS